MLRASVFGSTAEVTGVESRLLGLGRDLEGDEPIFFIRSELQGAHSAHARKMVEDMLRAMESSGMASQLIRACRRTGRPVAGQNQHLLSAEESEQLNPAVEEYFP